MNANTDFLQANPSAEDHPSVEHPSQTPAEHGTEPTGPRPRLGLLAVVGVLAVTGAFAAGYFPRKADRARVMEDAHALAMPTVAVAYPAPAKAAPALTLSGELRPLAETSIYARASGFVHAWTADLGAHVEAGQILAELDTPELNRQLAQARAELAQVDAASALAEITARRWREMLQNKAVSTQETDEKVADLALKRATVEASRANVQRLEELLSFNKITAPFSGTITMRQLDVGQLVTDGANRELYRIAKTDKLRVFVRVPQSYARAVTVGQTAELTVPEIPGRKFPGKIVRSAGAFDASSRTLLTEIEVDNSKNELLSGSYALVRLTDAHPEAALTLPAATLLFRPEGVLVAAVVDGKIVMHTVTLGRDFGATMEILDGVTPKDAVIVNPPDSVVDGMEVRVIAPKMPGA
jgi:RND family efflux transporter MFP subunit